MALNVPNALKYDLLFSIKSRILKRQPSVGKLSTLLITKYDDKHPTPDYEVYTSLAEVKRDHPMGTVRDFASNYFTYISKLGQSPDTLHIVTWTKTDKTAALIGGEAPSIDDLKKVKGKFNLTINTTTKTIELDLTSANSHTDIANKIQEAIKKNNTAVEGFKDATCSWNSSISAFIIKTGANGANIMPIQTPNDGTDISNRLGLSEGEGARGLPKQSKIEKLEQLLDKISKVNGTYYIITFDFEFDDINELSILGDFVDKSNFDYMALYTTTKSEVIRQYNYLTKFHKYTGLMVEYFPDRRPAGFSAALLSSIDFTKPNSNINIAYNDGSRYEHLAITDEHEYNNLLKNKANSFAKFGRTSVPHTWYQDGTMFGNISTANVYIGNSFVKFSLQQAFANFMSSQNFVGLSDTTAHQSIMALVDSIMIDARTAGILPLSVELSRDENTQLVSIFGDLGAAAIKSCEQTGYFANLDSIDLDKRCANIKIAYIANTPLQKVCISNFIIRGN